MIELYCNIDALRDPDPTKGAAARLRRIRGEVIEDFEPPKTKTLATRIRAWMVKPELLAANPHWFTHGQVAPNGTLWGDAEDPVEDEEAGKKRHLNIVGSRKRARTIDGRELATLQAQAAEELDGADVEELFGIKV